jgi:pyridoxal phosphate enzyme (YggS family)
MNAETSAQASGTVDVAANLAAVRARIDAAAVAAGRSAESVTLVAVPKTFPADHIRPALSAGHRVYGENRVQETAEKWPALRADFPDTTLHLIGPLQTNKVKEAVALFDVIETVDRPKLAAALRREIDRVGRAPICYVEINTGAEPQKAGVLPDHADAFLDQCRREFDLPIQGLMCLPPHNQDPAPHFTLLRDIARRNGLPVLSMGMTADFEIAIACGATHVRVGTAIFGQRAKRA